MKIISGIKYFLAGLIFFIGLGHGHCLGQPKNKKQDMNEKQAPINDDLISRLMEQHPQLFDSVLKKSDELKIQVIYTEIDREKKDKIKFRDHFYHVDSSNYYYPASTVKLPIAILALQKLNELNIPDLDK